MRSFSPIHPERHLLLALFLSISLVACDTLFQPTPTPDYRIHVRSGSQGMTAIAPECPAWSGQEASAFDNQPIPQFGCASARNLAMMVDRPDDLIRGRDFGDSSGVMANGAMRRYYNNQTRGLLDLSSSPDLSVAVTTATTATSSLTGDATGSASGSGSGSSSSSSSGSSGAAPAAVP